jgi:predicted nucleotidyltransferase
VKINPEEIERLLRRFTPAVAYLFGSTVSGRTRSDSDVDIAFLPSAQCDPYEVFLAAQEIASALGRDVDLVDLSRASAVMRAQVVGAGARLFTRDAGLAAEFEMYALSDYARANEERREALALFGKPAHA